ETQENHVPRLAYVFILDIVILCLLFIIPTIYQLRSFRFDNVDQSNFDSLITHAIRMTTQCEHNCFFRLDNHIFIPISTILCVIFIVLSKSKKNRQNGCLSPIEPFAINNRKETAALVGIVMIEVLMALENVLIDISELWNRGVLEQFLDRVLIPLVYSIRYYPIFISLQHRSRCIRLLAFIYMMVNIIYIIIRRCLCMNFLPKSEKISLLDEAKRRLELGNWVIIYGLLKSAPQFILLSYIGAELAVRFFYDGIFCSKKINEKPEEVITPGIGFGMHSKSSESSDSVQENNASSTICSSICGILDKLNRWDKTFGFTTMSTCAYTIAFVLVFYLTCIFAFQPIMETSSMSFLIFCLEHTLNIEIDEWSFEKEFFLSAILTMIIFIIQLVKGIMKYKDHTEQLKKDNYEEILSKSKLEENSIAPKSVEYIGVVFSSVVGGYYIWFHIILIIVSICSLFLFHAFTLQTHRRDLMFSSVAFIAPVLALYTLKHWITKWVCIFSTSHQSENESSTWNKDVYTILVYLTLVTNSAYMAYVSYLHMEKTYRQPARPELESIPMKEIIKRSIGVQCDPVDPKKMDDDSDISDHDTVSKETAEDAYDSLAGEEPATTENDDASSVVSSLYNRRDIISTPKDLSLPISANLQYGPSNSQQHTTNLTNRREATEQRSVYKSERDRSDSQISNRGSASSEEQPLISSTSTSNQEPGESPNVPRKTYKTTNAKLRDNYYNQSDV
ncbi:unnamed protein product, partial [Rotaria socialis]